MRRLECSFALSFNGPGFRLSISEGFFEGAAPAYPDCLPEEVDHALVPDLTSISVTDAVISGGSRRENTASGRSSGEADDFPTRSMRFKPRYEASPFPET
jgi:hypothetical protein